MPFNKKEDRRRHKRYVVDGIQGNVLYPSDLNIINMSINGAAIETSKRIELNREYSFKIKYRGDFLHLKGIVVWSVLSQTEKKDSGELIPVYRAGIKFTNILNERVNMLLSFIEENRLMPSEKRFRGIRVRIASSENVKIDLPCKIDVKKISLSGMLVETECRLTTDSHYDIEILLKENILNIVGRITNCVKIGVKDAAHYDVGIAFTEIQDKDKEVLKGFLDSLEES